MAVIEHTGDARPVPSLTVVRVWLKYEAKARVGLAEEFCWRTLDDRANDIKYSESRILRYEVLDEASVPPTLGPVEKIFSRDSSHHVPPVDPTTNPLAEPVAASIASSCIAPELLKRAAKHMDDRAVTYDQPGGERSMASTIAAFNAITGHKLSEADGWLLMALLKMVRSEQRDAPHRDSAEDLIAYAALYGEARLGGR